MNQYRPSAVRRAITDRFRGSQVHGPDADETTAVLTGDQVAAVRIGQESFGLENPLDPVEVPTQRLRTAGFVSFAGLPGLEAKCAHHGSVAHGVVKPRLDEVEAHERGRHRREKPQQNFGEQRPHTPPSVSSPNERTN